MMNSRPSSASRNLRSAARSVCSRSFVWPDPARKASISESVSGPRQLSYHHRNKPYKAKANNQTPHAPAIPPSPLQRRRSGSARQGSASASRVTDSPRLGAARKSACRAVVFRPWDLQCIRTIGGSCSPCGPGRQGGGLCSAARIRAIVNSIGALLATSKPSRRPMSLTLAGFKGKPPASTAAIRSSARCRSGSGSRGSSAESNFFHQFTRRPVQRQLGRRAAQA